MEQGKTSFNSLQFCNFKLDTLLDVTTAINHQFSSGKLLVHFELILSQRLNVGKTIVLKYESDEWDTILWSGEADGIEEPEINVEKLLDYKENIICFKPNEKIADFDIFIPVYHKEKPLAFVLIGDLGTELQGQANVLEHLRFVQTLTNIIFVAIENKRLNEEIMHNYSLAQELELAAKVQTQLIPNRYSFPKIKDILVDSYYRPHMNVGGDYYDFIKLSDDEFGFLIADVTGKGISAALLMSNFQATVRALYTKDISLPSLVEKLNERVISISEFEKFITMFIGKYNCRTKDLLYINAGHIPPILYEQDTEESRFLEIGCVGLGMLDIIPNIKMETIKTRDSKILMYTDGLVELEYEDKIEDGTKVIVDSLSNDDPIVTNIEDIIERMRVYEENKALFDDITILGIQFF